MPSLTYSFLAPAIARLLPLSILLLPDPLCQGAELPWQQAMKEYQIQLPRDHGAHRDTRIEWWYFTGNVATAEGRELGYQLTFFRIGIQQAPANPSPWAVRDLHMVHFAISDLTKDKYYAAQRLDRAGPGICGADAQTLHVWHEKWVAQQSASGSIKLAADEPNFALDLEVQPVGTPLLHGDAGYSRKGSQEGNASIYYSLTRLKTTGKIRLGDQWLPVTGLSWMDHEFGTSFLEKGQRGWDWFSLHLDDGSDLMLFQLRQDDPAAAKHSAGTLRKPSGDVVSLKPGDFSLKPARSLWKSPKTAAQYPLQWEISVPSQDLQLSTDTPVPAQEMTGQAGPGGPSYWEGAIRATGSLGQRPIKSSGYLEMTGYGDQGIGQFFSFPTR